jgi:hypothetical protein
MGPIGCPETSVTTNLRCVASKKSEDLFARSLVYLFCWFKFTLVFRKDVRFIMRRWNKWSGQGCRVTVELLEWRQACRVVEPLEWRQSCRVVEPSDWRQCCRVTWKHRSDFRAVGWLWNRWNDVRAVGWLCNHRVMIKFMKFSLDTACCKWSLLWFGWF